MSQNPGNFQEEEYEHLMGKHDCQVSETGGARLEGTVFRLPEEQMLEAVSRTPSGVSAQQTPTL